jgi:hypothetical protein
VNIALRILEENPMSITLQKICESLRTHYGHHELWLGWRDWKVRKHRQDMEKQPFVASCSGRCLATYDGEGDCWSFIPARDQLRFSEQTDFYILARNKDFFLNDHTVAVLKDKYRF